MSQSLETRVLTVTTETVSYIADEFARRVLSGRQKVMRIEMGLDTGHETIFQNRFQSLGYEVFMWYHRVLRVNAIEQIETTLETTRKDKSLSVVLVIGCISDLNEHDFPKARRIELALEAHARAGGNILYILPARSA